MADKGLYAKYEVYKDGVPIHDVFVLRPRHDPVAQMAIKTYARHTEDVLLASDLERWMKALEGTAGWTA